MSQKVLNSDKVLSQQSANVPNAVDDSSCLMQADNDYMYIGSDSSPTQGQPAEPPAWPRGRGGR